MSLKRTRLTAYHEAGHVVVQVRLDPDLVIKGITIVPSEKALGRCIGEAWTRYLRDEIDLTDQVETAMEHEILSSLAGYVAQVRLDPCHDARARGGAASDFDGARHLLGMLRPNDPGAFDEYLSRAEGLVEANWLAISAVAEELQDRKTLDGDEVAILVEISDGDSTAEDLALYRDFLARCKSDNHQPEGGEVN